jgi:two-component system response regulator FixJ
VIHIVDDDADVRASTGFLLRSHGYATETYADGRAFLSASTLNEGCVLLDLRMPHMSGFEVQEALSDRKVDLPVIVMSGHGDTHTAAEAMRLGAVGFLEKPYAEDALIAAIAHASRLGAAARNEKADAGSLPLEG